MNQKNSVVDFVIGTGKATKFVVTERIITVATRFFTDVPMLGFILADPTWGWVKSMIFVTPLYVLVCAMIVFIHDRFHEKGIDLTGIEEMRDTCSDETLKKNQLVKRFIRWFMQRESLIFWIGSFFYLDPDYVTLMLRKKGDSFVKTVLTLTVPSVIISMLVWTTVYWAIYQPFKDMAWAKWISGNLDWL